VETLTEDAYTHLREGAEVLAADEHGDKVLLLADGTYLKMFRVKRLFTSARLFPYWRRFQVNAEKLAELGIPTLKVKEVYRVPHLDRTAVHYDALPGETLRQVKRFDADLAARLGEFIRELHDKGVYLRSMHLGNVVLTPEGRLGLIDVADMRVKSSPLSNQLRFRNFHHLCRYTEDRKVIEPFAESFLAAFDDAIVPRYRRMLSGL
jgi:tRNA A-37 threonylcarbamoyl transferase component Bud32